MLFFFHGKSIDPRDPQIKSPRDPHLIWLLVVWNHGILKDFPWNSWEMECHHPNCYEFSIIFQRGWVKTTNQICSFCVDRLYDYWSYTISVPILKVASAWRFPNEGKPTWLQGFPSHVHFFIVNLSMFPIFYVSYKVPLVYDLLIVYQAIS